MSIDIFTDSSIWPFHVSIFPYSMPLKTKPTKRTADLSDIAFQRLRQAILTGELKEGERVRELRLAKEWNTGVTPLREAVRRMAAIGYLILKPNHAPVVRKLSSSDIREIYVLRELLECFALRQNWDTIRKADLQRLKILVAKAKHPAATKLRKLKTQFHLDTELHNLWISPEKGPWLASILERLLAYRPNLINIWADHPKFVDEAFVEHQQILAALEKCDLDLAVEQLALHIRKSGAVLTNLSDELPSILPNRL